MKKEPSQNLKEVRNYGENSFACAVYQTRAVGKGRYVKHHWHEEVELLYFFSGEFSLEINMETYEIRSECFYFINPGELHSITSLSDGNTGEDAIVFHMGILSFENYDSTQTELILPIQNGRLLLPRCIPQDHPAFPPIRQAFYDIMHTVNRKPSEQFPNTQESVAEDLTSQLYLKASLLKIFAHLSAQGLLTATEAEKNKQVDSIKNVLTYIRENYQEKIYIRDLAGQAGMNEQYFCRFFRKTIGKTPMEYVNEYRIRMAMSLLKETELTVTEICLECGFHNLGNFLREFRGQTGTTPLKYRKMSI